MSSFVISKEEYIKAAGIVAGCAGFYRDFWVYDYKTKRNATEEDYYNNFCTCYKLNAKSVQAQYEDPEAETDPEEYKETFQAYKKKAVQYITGNNTKKIYFELKSFFRSALYQTEDKKASVQMEMFFNRILNQLFDYMFHPSEDIGSWGSLDI